MAHCITDIVHKLGFSVRFERGYRYKKKQIHIVSLKHFDY
jgi:hypothetical protein